ncbi:hypothetical protein [Cognatiyoonia sp. IB215182]|uniref:capsular polysaccharide export protein, LipB/KpsS family n=1 Tax=Cognatiyoonia sp. IB215182 TaxID=3097353 RepID=UPI002A0B516B|nr:hypothetical protein [Cognatiyoonia sp. IB215182]MDX8352665.1 hypothetical protein [Cognatiyoonia sp. IB215182]
MITISFAFLLGERNLTLQLKSTEQAKDNGLQTHCDHAFVQKDDADLDRHFLASARLPEKHGSTQIFNIAPLSNEARVLIRGHSRDRINALQQALCGPRTTHIHMPHTGAHLFPPREFRQKEKTRRVIDELVASYRPSTKRAVKRVIYRGQAWYIASLMMQTRPDICVCWNGVRGHRRLFMDVAQDLGIPHLYMEESPVPERITCDLAGVNFENSLPRRMDYYRLWQARAAGVARKEWRSLADRLAARVTERTHTSQLTRDLGDEGKYIFCPLQVPTDSQVVSFGGRFKSMEQYVETLCNAAKALPRGWHLRIKEHPSSQVTFRDMIKRHVGEKLKLDNSTDTFLQVKHAKSVLTLNSSVGIQAFYFDKPVMTLGHAFWDFGGLAEHLATSEALMEALANPTRSWFSERDRAAFMNYLTFVYYVIEQDVADGKIGLNDIIGRAADRDALLAEVQRDDASVAVTRASAAHSSWRKQPVT